MLAKLLRQSTVSTKKAKLSSIKRHYSTTKELGGSNPDDGDSKESDSASDSTPKRTFVAKANASIIIVEKLGRYIIGQNKAKRAVSVALQNRWRRQQLDT